VEYQVAISPRAFRDLNLIWARIAKDSLVNADRFVPRLLAAARELDHLPRRGAEIGGTEGARFLVLDSYLIVYRIIEEKKKVRVLRFWHAARDIRRLRL
jgi:plasmid stabilization system protein ParE